MTATTTENDKSVVPNNLELEVEDDGALTKGGEISYLHPFKLGLFYHKFLQGSVLALIVMRTVTYPFFGRYLNLQGNEFNAISAIISLMWAMKIFWAFLSDGCSIFGKYRVPYMIMGWTIASILFYSYQFISLPESYYGVVRDGERCYQNQSDIQNPNAGESASTFLTLLVICLFFFGMTDVASDALAVEYGRREPIAKRGKATGYCTISETGGMAIANIFAGIAMNSAEYGGRFCFGLRWDQLMTIYGTIALFGVINAALFTIEPPKSDTYNIKKNMIVFWDMLASESFIRVSIFFYFGAMLMGMRSSAGLKIKTMWVKVEPLTGAAVSLICILIVMGSMVIYERFFINTNWRFALSMIYLTIFPVGLLSETLAIFDVIRNQYMHFFDEILSSAPFAIYLFIMMQLATEVSEEGSEGIAFGLMMTLWGFGSPLANTLSNLICGPFNVVNDERYARDSMEDRLMVFYSTIIPFCINCSALILVHTILPKQKAHVQEIKKKGKRYPKVRAVFVCFLVLSLVISSGVNILATIRQTSCLQIAGGSGCKS